MSTKKVVLTSFRGPEQDWHGLDKVPMDKIDCYMSGTWQKVKDYSKHKIGEEACDVAIFRGFFPSRNVSTLAQSLSHLLSRLGQTVLSHVFIVQQTSNGTLNISGCVKFAINSYIFEENILMHSPLATRPARPLRCLAQALEIHFVSRTCAPAVYFFCNNQCNKSFGF